MRKILLTITALIALGLSLRAQDETYLYAIKDGQELFMDEYRPNAKNSTLENGQKKPTVIFVFGGGFIGGSRSNRVQNPWFEKLAEDGYRVFSIDYRLGLRGVQAKGFAMVNKIHDAVNMAVEDLFSATAYILQNAEMLGVDPDNIVASGSSAGAIASLQGEWEICNLSDKATSILPQGFNYAGIMSFSGAILSNQGKPKYRTKPCPQLLFHGTADKIVNYKQLHILKWCFSGSSSLLPSIKKKGGTYQIYRFKDYGHEIASSMSFNYEKEIEFLENIVASKGRTNKDETVIESEYPKTLRSYGKKDLYGKKPVLRPQ